VPMMREAERRSLRAPAIGATIIGIAVQGKMRSPDCSGEYPCTVWKNCASRKIEPNMPKNMKRLETFARANVRLRKKRIGSIGSSVRSSQATNAARRSAPAVTAPTISGEAQPTALPRTRPHTMPRSPALASASPGRSSFAAAP